MKSSHVVSSVVVPSPVGNLTLLASEKGLAGVYFANRWKGPTPFVNSAYLEQTSAELEAYFSGKLEKFSIPCDLRGTSFQLSVWKRLAQIPFGEVLSYGQLAAEIGNPKASRAVGLANGSNPISIVVPCHRVLGANGSLTGFGGGLDRKKRLLEHEGILTPELC
ncbi:MAG: methylated-DNA--[protein]-cysteine S-methyltransferase [Verrucomicrobiota bacterium]